MHTQQVTLTVNPKLLHQQIAHLAALQTNAVPDDSNEANTLKNTVSLLQRIESEMRQQVRQRHLH